MKRTWTDPGEDYRWNTDRLVNAGDFNTMNSVSIFAGPIFSMFTEITKTELKTLLDRGEDIRLLCVLDKKEFEGAHLPGSINIPVDRIEDKSRDLLKKDDLLIVYGRSAGSAESVVAADKLLTLGFENILVYKGGVEEWTIAGYPLGGRRYEAAKKAA